MTDWHTDVEKIHEHALKHSDIKPWSTEDVRFLALALCGETGELANLVKKQWRGRPQDQPGLDAKIKDEVADIAIYLHLLTTALGYDINTLVGAKLPEIAGKYEVP